MWAALLPLVVAHYTTALKPPVRHHHPIRRSLLAGGLAVPAVLVLYPTHALQGDALDLYKERAAEKERKRAAKRVEYGAPKLDPLKSDLPDLSALESKAKQPQQKAPPTATPAAPPKGAPAPPPPKGAPAPPLTKGAPPPPPKVSAEPSRAKAQAPDIKSLLKDEVATPTAPKIVGGDAPLKEFVSEEERKAARKREVLSGEYAKRIKQAKAPSK